MKNVIIAGYGFVGKAVASAISHNTILHIVDPKENDNRVSNFENADGLIICVGTPSTDYYDCDISQILAVLSDTPPRIPILIKSTVPPDYLERISYTFDQHSICYSPEFLRAVSANDDFKNQGYMVIGGDDRDNQWENLFKNTLPNCKTFIHTTITEASMIKYATNCFLSTKVSFFNQLYDICEINGADYNKVRDALLHDARIGDSHMQVPGPDGSRGFGGACFPKDTKAFSHYAERIDADISVLNSAIHYNNLIR